MKVAILGGTGKMGRAVARHLSKQYDVVVGSRDPARGREAANRIPNARGADYYAAANECEVVVFSVPYSAMKAASDLVGSLDGKLVVSMINPIRRVGGYLGYALEKGSAAEELAALHPRSRVATAFNNVPVAMMKEEEVVPMDILVAATSKEAYEKAAELVRSIRGLRPLYAGPLSEAQVVERITPLVLNLAKWNETGSLATKFVSRKG